ncbi:MAG: shikimate kinase [Gammaproteobacteria bacterium]
MGDDDRLFLIGAMGAGKSAVGRALAGALGYEFADSDACIERHAGVDISFIFEKEGESGFRQREHRALCELTQHQRIVIATGGGCVVTPDNRTLMQKNGLVIYLQASVEQLFERVRCSSHRPLIQTDDPQAALARIVEDRLPLYRELADLVVDTEGQRVKAVAQNIHRALIARQADKHKT